MPKSNQHADKLEAFCSSCPAPKEVTSFLERLGMHLDFQMEACPPSTSSGLAVLPAQFHFADASGMSIMYLAGEDSPFEECERLPPHKSRFWAYPGADVHVFGWITRSMALQWAGILLASSVAGTPGCRIRRGGKRAHTNGLHRRFLATTHHKEGWLRREGFHTSTNCSPDLQWDIVVISRAPWMQSHSGLAHQQRQHERALLTLFSNEEARSANSAKE